MPSWLHGTEEFGFAHIYHCFMGVGVGVATPKPYLFSFCVSYMHNFKSYYMLRRDARLAVKSNSFFAHCSRFAQSPRTPTENISQGNFHFQSFNVWRSSTQSMRVKNSSVRLEHSSENALSASSSPDVFKIRRNERFLLKRNSTSPLHFRTSPNPIYLVSVFLTCIISSPVICSGAMRDSR